MGKGGLGRRASLHTTFYQTLEQVTSSLWLINKSGTESSHNSQTNQLLVGH